MKCCAVGVLLGGSSFPAISAEVRIHGDALFNLWCLSNEQTRCEVPAQLLRSVNAPWSARSPPRLCQTCESSGSRLVTQDSARRSPRRCSLCASKLPLIGKTNLLCSTCGAQGTHPPTLCRRCCRLFGAAPDEQHCQVFVRVPFYSGLPSPQRTTSPRPPPPCSGLPFSSSGSRLLQIPLPSEECVLETWKPFVGLSFQSGVCQCSFASRRGVNVVQNCLHAFWCCGGVSVVQTFSPFRFSLPMFSTPLPSIPLPLISCLQWQCSAKDV